jgi:hypothetical protein
MDWYILFDRGATSGIETAGSEEAAIERARDLMRAGVREVRRFDARRAAITGPKLTKLCVERERRSAHEAGSRR